jgi:DNA ligase D-like protein (predicted ligase)
MRNVKRTVHVHENDLPSDLAPRWIEPQLCKLVTKISAGDGWAHEIKFDGFRIHARIDGGAAALLTRNGLDWTAKYLDIATAIGALERRQAHLDGELCALRPDGTTSFAALQGHGDTPPKLTYLVFDLLHIDGEDLIRLPLLERKARLEALLSDAPPVLRFCGHVIGNGARVSEEGAKLGVEGMVSKQIDKPYMPGNRGVWVKTKFLNRQEFVIVGWTDPEGSRSSLGSLLLGYYADDDKLIYAGRAGTGMTESELRALLTKLRPLASDRMTVDVPPPKTSRFGKPLVLTRVHWVRPELVAEVTYLTWTADGLLRQVVYEGLRCCARTNPHVTSDAPVSNRGSGPRSCGCGCPWQPWQSAWLRKVCGQAISTPSSISRPGGLLRCR